MQPDEKGTQKDLIFIGLKLPKVILKLRKFF